MNALNPYRPRKDNPPLTHNLKVRLSALLVVGLLAGCSQKGQLDETGGIYAVRSSCPQVAIPGETDTITDLADGFLGAGLGGLFLAAWAMTRYTSRRLPHRFERDLVKDALSAG